MWAELVREVEARHRVELALAEALVSRATGVLVLVEPSVTVSRLPEGLLAAVEVQLHAGASLHVISGELLALVCPSVSLLEGWGQVEAVREHFAAHGLQVNLGLSAWPLHGSTVTDVFAAAVAGLVDDRSRLPLEEAASEGDLEFEGLALSWTTESDLLSA